MASFTHELKTWPEYYAAVERREKTFEVRKADRTFMVGDVLILREYDPCGDGFTGGSIKRTVSYVLQGGQFGIEAGYVVLGLKN